MSTQTRDLILRLLQELRFEELGYPIVDVVDRYGDYHTGQFSNQEIVRILEEMYDEVAVEYEDAEVEQSNQTSMMDVEFEMDFDSDTLISTSEADQDDD